MNDSSLLMIHNAWSWGDGNAEQLRKLAEDLDKITQASVVAYLAHSTLTEEEIKDLMDKETWILPEEALEYGFATSIEKTEKKAASQKARLIDIIKMHRQQADTQEGEGEEEPKNPVEDDETEEGETPADGEEKPVDEKNDGSNADEDAPDTDNEQTVQKLNGFFNAILKM